VNIMTTTRSKATGAAVRWLAGLAVGLMLAGGGVWAGGGDQGTATLSRQPVPDMDSVSPAARKAYAEFWKGLAKPKADALERELNALEARVHRGESIDPDLVRLRHNYPQLFQMSSSLDSALWIITSSNGPQRVKCVGLGWIGRNGRLRCLGRLTI
jgi:hypothetical protein